jgi:Holliday junction resolvase RusA-like endonuclease
MMIDAESKETVIKALSLAHNPTLEVTLDFHFEPPKSSPKRLKMNHNKKPDIDNLIKFVLDAGNMTLWADDRFIQKITATKSYDLVARTLITLTVLEPICH